MTTEKNEELVRIIKYRKEHPRCSCCKYSCNNGNFINPRYFCNAKCTDIFLFTSRRMCSLFTPIEYV